jgi:KRAB domain-containing zinc finger protein
MDRDLIIPFADDAYDYDTEMHLYDELNQMESRAQPHLFDLLPDQNPYPHNDPMDDAFIEQVNIYHHWCDAEGCNKVYKDRNTLMHHRRMKHSGRQTVFPCDHPGCNKVFVTQDAFNRHKGKHMRINPGFFPCEEPGCGEVYTNASSLRFHKGSKHADHGKIQCPICHNIMIRFGFNRHMKDVHNTNPYPCDECNMSFNRQSDLTQHKRALHRPHRCTHPGCNLYIRHYTESQYSAHMNTHRNERQFKCHKCAKGFNKTHNLRRHERTCKGPR